jgi:2'-5' RNA ligase
MNKKEKKDVKYGEGERISLRSMRRLFFAIRMPQEALPVLELAQDHLPKQGARFSLTHEFHLTFKFLGEVEALTEMQVRIAARNVAKALTFTPQDLELSFVKPEIFYNKNNDPTVVSVGVRMSAALYQFHYELEAALDPFGFRIEKHRFKPHITLAHIHEIDEPVRKEVVYMLRQVHVKSALFSVKEFELIQSDLKYGKASHYEILETFPFKF